MTYVSLCFEVHQPLRLKKNFFWDRSQLREVIPASFTDFYFDDDENRRIFERVSSKCYLPANRIILEAIRRFENSDRPFKAAYSFSGVFLDQCRRYKPEVLDSFKDLADTGMVEVLEQTYYHSLTSLFFDKKEFFEQVKMHRELIWDIFGLKPNTFENTELIYNDEVAKLADGMGYKAIFTEGIIADPNYVYRPKDMEIALLLRNYQLTDDVGFRFSSRWWEEYPLTADKYSAWLATAPGDCINIFCDYETFGEHQWEETGILDFLKYLPQEVLKWDSLKFATPGEIARDVPPKDELSVEKHISWADLERDTSCWLGNALQHACFSYLERLEGPAKESPADDVLEIWRLLGLSDHLYYMFTHGGGPGEVHSYFSPYGNPYDAAVTYFSVLSDLHYRLKRRLKLADEPFKFSLGPDLFTGDEAWSLEALYRILSRIKLKSIDYHNHKGDFTAWARSSLGDEWLAEEMESLRGMKGKELRNRLLDVIGAALKVGR